ncbi:hypothetical protein EVG20_g9137 [Dentipellis fragilis]|uniref:Uncharacterized protein n=1 Tax=Dentipellis fragilis TaxID=205917 RepID=A0A4Y9Y0Q6_9AGAM|nr:hypothetical protein EVG20_g9137 [Dentipellis fragilis]
MSDDLASTNCGGGQQVRGGEAFRAGNAQIRGAGRQTRVTRARCCLLMLAAAPHLSAEKLKITDGAEWSKALISGPAEPGRTCMFWSIMGRPGLVVIGR